MREQAGEGREATGSGASVAVAPAESRLEALTLLMAELPLEVRAQQAALALRELMVEPGGLWLARGPTGELLGAAWGQPQPGRTGLLWPPRLVGSLVDVTRRSELAAALAARATEFLEEGGASFLQANVAPEEPHLPALRQAGFQLLARLLYLGADLESLGTLSPALPFTCVPYQPAMRSRLAGVLEASYRGTLDCPALNGLRTLDETIAGYLATGTSQFDHWFLLRAGHADIGCLLLAQHPGRQSELVYLGLTPAVRGRGWGLWAVKFALNEAQRLGNRHLLLAVDAGNGPARAVYRAAGMQELDQRLVYWKRCQPGAEPSTAHLA